MDEESESKLFSTRTGPTSSICGLRIPYIPNKKKENYFLRIIINKINKLNINSIYSKTRETQRKIPTERSNLLSRIRRGGKCGGSVYKGYIHSKGATS